jgi:hypothetical protein
MKKIQLITKIDCNRCDLVKKWLEKHNVPFEEWKIEDRKHVDFLLNDPLFLEKFDDPMSLDGVPLPTPAIRMVDTGDYYSKEIFGIFELREDFLKKILEIKIIL